MENRHSVLALIAINVVVFILQNLIESFTGAFVLSDVANRPFTLMTSMFMHGSIFHLLSNMFALFVFGMILEHNIGTKKFLVVYFSAGILSGLAASFFYASSLGASGAIFGVMGFLAAIQPRLVVWTYGVPLPMAVAAGFWLLLDIGGVFYPSDVASMAHIVGLIFGVVVGLYSVRGRAKPKKEKRIFLIPEKDFQHWEDQWM